MKLLEVLHDKKSTKNHIQLIDIGTTKYKVFQILDKVGAELLLTADLLAAYREYGPGYDGGHGWGKYYVISKRRNFLFIPMVPVIVDENEKMYLWKDIKDEYPELWKLVDNRTSDSMIKKVFYGLESVKGIVECNHEYNSISTSFINPEWLEGMIKEAACASWIGESDKCSISKMLDEVSDYEDEHETSRGVYRAIYDLDKKLRCERIVGSAAMILYYVIMEG